MIIESLPGLLPKSVTSILRLDAREEFSIEHDVIGGLGGGSPACIFVFAAAARMAVRRLLLAIRSSRDHAILVNTPVLTMASEMALAAPQQKTLSPDMRHQ